MRRLIPHRARVVRLGPAVVGVAAALATPASAAPQALVVSFTRSANVHAGGGRFTSATSDVSSVNAVLRRHPGIRFEPLVDATAGMAGAGRGVGELSRYFRISAPDAGEREALAADLERLPVVDAAIAEPRPVPPPASPSFVALQGYRGTGAAGLGAPAVAALPGGRGEGVRIADVEYSWDSSHEDLSKARAAGVVIANGTPMDPFSSTDHGTAVLGVVSGDDNAFGVTGLAPAADLRLVNSIDAQCNGCWDIADAVNVAAAHLTAGDVMVVEQQTPLTAGGTDYAPAEWYAPAYEAIRRATQRGIIVVEAAGNGGLDLDGAAFGPRFHDPQASSGAIVVGAGTGACSGTARARLPFSNYGSRVDLQGWGECVATTGGGDLFDGGTGSRYTAVFAGTSAATAMVAGAAAVYSSLYQARHGAAPGPPLVRERLIATGTPQVAPSTGHIGPLPDLQAAAAEIVDAVQPTVDAVSPAPGGPDAAQETTITASFNEPMDHASVEAAMSVTAADGGAPVAGAFAWTGSTVTFTPKAPLAPAQTYDAAVGKGAHDLFGKALGAAVSWRFRTTGSASAPGGTGPTPGTASGPPDVIEVAGVTASAGSRIGIPRFDIRAGATVRPSGRRLAVRLTCGGDAACPGVTVRLQLYRDRTLVHEGSARVVTVARGQTVLVRLALDGQTRRRLRRGSLRAVLVATDAAGRHRSPRFTIRASRA